MKNALGRMVLMLGLWPLLLHAQTGEPEEVPLTLAQAKAQFAKVDKQLNESWALTKKALDEWEFEKLREDQREWLEYRDRRAEEAVYFDHGDTPEGKAKETAHYWQWLSDLTTTRLEILSGWRGVGDPDSWSGRYIDGFGGHLQILETKRGFHFAINVVRGPTYHLGEIGGKAVVNKHHARYTDANTDPDQGEAWLTFVKEGKQLEIIGTNTVGYHGARAYFDGKYIRVAELTAKERAELIKPAAEGVE